jgi:hypothetical protein
MQQRSASALPSRIGVDEQHLDLAIRYCDEADDLILFVADAGYLSHLPQRLAHHGPEDLSVFFAHEVMRRADGRFPHLNRAWHVFGMDGKDVGQEVHDAAMLTSGAVKPRLTSFAPQFLVDDLARSMSYYTKLGFTFGEPWQGFYAIGHLDGLELHLKEAPKNEDERRHRRDNEHLDASDGVDGFIRQQFSQHTGPELKRNVPAGLPG